MTKFYRNVEKNAKDCKGQAKLVLDAINASTTPETALTVDEVAKAIQDAGLKTVQTPKRIASYYLQIFKKTGIVRKVETAEDEATAVDEVRAGTAIDPETTLDAVASTDDEDDDDPTGDDDDEDLEGDEVDDEELVDVIK